MSICGDFNSKRATKPGRYHECWLVYQSASPVFLLILRGQCKKGPTLLFNHINAFTKVVRVRPRLQTKSLFSPSSSSSVPCLDMAMCGGQQRLRRSQKRGEREKKKKSFVRSFVRRVCLSICPSQATFPLADLTNDGGKEMAKRRRSAKHFTTAMPPSIIRLASDGSTKHGT